MGDCAITRSQVGLCSRVKAHMQLALRGINVCDSCQQMPVCFRNNTNFIPGIRNREYNTTNIVGVVSDDRQENSTIYNIRLLSSVVRDLDPPESFALHVPSHWLVENFQCTRYQHQILDLIGVAWWSILSNHLPSVVIYSSWPQVHN